jgi:hypothetical protein
VIQPVLPLHECATEPLQDVVEPVAESAAIEAAADPAAEHLHSTADLAGSSAALTETFCFCVRFESLA